MDCVFCKIISGDIPSFTVYEDELVCVFLDINPSTNGECLVVPKAHYANILDIPTEVIAHIHEVSKKVYDILKNTLSIDGLTLIQNNFYGQEIKHYHLHLTPRYKNDSLEQCFNKDILIDVEDIYQKIKSAIE